MVELARAEHPFINDSFATHSSRNMSGPLLANLLYFQEHERDLINDETIELLQPYLNLTPTSDPGKKLFNPEIARQTSQALYGLSTYVIALNDYNKHTKQSIPKLRELEAQSSAFAQVKAALYGNASQQPAGIAAYSKKSTARNNEEEKKQR